MLSDKKRILVVGCPGAGKTTLARALATHLGLPVVHLDRHFWQPGWVPTPADDWDEKLGELLAEPAWVMDGDYNRTLERRLRIADAAVFLDLSARLCRFRTLKRIALGYGRSRPDLPEACPEHLDFGFLRWTWTWHQQVRAKVLQSLREAEDRVRVLRLRTPREVEGLISVTAEGPRRDHACL